MLRDKNKRKSTGGFFRFLQRGNENSPQKHGNNDDYEIAPRLPPPYNAPHRPIPSAVPPHGSLKPRSLSHEPLSSKDNLKSKEDAMIHEVIAGTKAGTLQPGNVLRRKKIEPAPSFKMAMSNSQPAFGNSEGEQQVQDFHPEMLRDKNKRKSTGGFFRFLQRGNENNSSQKHGNNDDYEIAPRLPPPYNSPHRPIPPAVPPHGSQAFRYPRTAPGPISHHRIHSAQESTSNHDVFLVSNSSTLPTKRINYQEPTNIGVSGPASRRTIHRQHGRSSPKCLPHLPSEHGLRRPLTPSTATIQHSSTTTPSTTTT
uniref:Uncharacterized protein n=1 Tax=Panagrolaimus sp. PS1159 TaxID=55785 RepID=A0AC35EVY7_9BILA